nr:hypothetical protein [Tanacetum cinerariifolium]
MDFRNFMMQEIDGEFKFLSEGCIDDNQCSPSSKSINNEASVINTKPLTSIHPTNYVEDVADSDDTYAGDNENPLVGTSLPPLLEAGKKLRLLGKRKLPSGIRDSLLKSFLQPKREFKNDIAYAELERKCNEALLDLDKNQLVVDMQTEIDTLQGRVYGLHKMDALKRDRASVVTKLVPDAATKLIRSDEIGMLVAKLVKAFIIYARCAAFEEVAKLKEPFVMEKMVGYRPSSKQEFDQAADDLTNASGPRISIPHCEKGQADVINVISCFGFLVTLDLHAHTFLFEYIRVAEVLIVGYEHVVMNCGLAGN